MQFSVEIEPVFGKKEKLYIEWILLAYIYPRAFICRNDEGTRYVFYEMESEKDIDTWLVSVINDDEFSGLTSGRKPIQLVYAEGHTLLAVSFNYLTEKSITTTDSHRIEELIKLLPKENVYAEE